MTKKIALLLLLIYAGGWGKKMIQVNIAHFNAHQFGVWFPLMSKRLIEAVDKMAETLAPMGYTFTLSRIGLKSEDSTSQHNVTKWGEVRAVDLNVLLHGRKLTKSELAFLFGKIVELRLFSGIGVYPNWNTPGVHLDVREDRTVTSPAQWGDAGKGVNHDYVSVAKALA